MNRVDTMLNKAADITLFLHSQTVLTTPLKAIL